MLLCLLLCALLPSINGRSWYPLYVPLSFGGEDKHTTHVVPQKIFRTKVLVLHDHPKSGLNHPESRDNHKVAPPDSHLHDQIMSIEHGDHLGKLQSYEDYRSIGSPRRFKYSVPVKESSWKPKRGVADRRYIPLKYLGEDGERISQVIYQAMEDSGSYEAKTNLILPIGIKKLHNPQLRRPGSKYVYSKDGVVEGRYVKKPLLLRNHPAWRNNSMLNLSEREIRCHCRIP